MKKIITLTTTQATSEDTKEKTFPSKYWEKKFMEVV